jgi:ribosomal protein L11 methyltransferase
MKIWYAIEAEIIREAEGVVAAQLWAAGTTGIEVSDERPDVITLRAYFGNPPDKDRTRAEISRALRLASLPETALFRLENLAIPEQDWLSEWKKGYQPVTIGKRLLITPSWKRDHDTEAERIVVQIDPGMAFGTGTHETTRGCLEMLERYWSGGALLDAGTGTGILAIAAAKLYPQSRIVAFDVDPEAVEVALENARINGVGDEVEISVDRISTFADLDFDLTIANLTADVIIPIADDLRKTLKSGGVLIVSGILAEQAGDVTLALESLGLKPIETLPDGEWITQALRS